MEGTLAVVDDAVSVLSVVTAVLALALVGPWGASAPLRVQRGTLALCAPIR